MQEWVINLESALPIDLVGRKAAALGRLIETAFPIPRSLCITTEAFKFATLNKSDELYLPDGLSNLLTQLLPKDVPLVVRSSAVQEDSPEVSLAGRFSTSLNVLGAAALERAVLDCWRSYFSVDSADEDGGMAVLVQPLIEAECAGVCFTVDQRA